MKTIEVTDKMYDSLMELSEEVTTQDNRATAMPYFFQVQTKEKTPAFEGNGTKCWVYDGSEIETEEEIKEAIFEYKEWDLEEDIDIKTYESLSDFQREVILGSAGWQQYNYEITEKYSNAFLTEKACKKHIELNKHHYNNPVDFLSHAFRNPDMELIYGFLCSLQNKNIKK